MKIEIGTVPSSWLEELNSLGVPSMSGSHTATTVELSKLLYFDGYQYLTSISDSYRGVASGGFLGDGGVINSFKTTLSGPKLEVAVLYSASEFSITEKAGWTSNHGPELKLLFAGLSALANDKPLGQDFVARFLAGDDTITGNDHANSLTGGSGNDRLIGGKGADQIDGGTGTDVSVYRESAFTDHLLSRNSSGVVSVSTRDGTTDKNTNIETLEFSSRTVATNSLTYLPSHTPVPASSVQPVYRFYNDRDKAFFYTKDAAEKDMIIKESTDPSFTPNNGVWPYFYQGATFEAAHSSAGSVPVHRFYNTKTGHHFFTTSASERDMVQRESTDPAFGQPGPLWTFVYEGEAFNAFTDSNHKDAAPVYRFYSPSLDRHFFTASADEAAQVRLTGLWTDEGIGYWGEQTG